MVLAAQEGEVGSDGAGRANSHPSTHSAPPLEWGRVLEMQKTAYASTYLE